MSKQAKEFSNPKDLKQYLHDHPGADPHKHTVTRPDGGSGSGAARTKHKVDKGVAGDIEKVWKNKPSGNAVDKVKNMVERGDEVSVNMIQQAVGVLKNEMHDAKGDEKKGLKGLHDKLRSYIHSKEARNIVIAQRVARRRLALPV